MPERTIQTGIGPVAVRQPRVRDGGGAEAGQIRFSSTLLPRYARRTRSLDALLPVLYLRGISTGDMQEALAALLGKDAPNLSLEVLARLKSGWQEEYERWKGRDLSVRRYVYIWAEGVYLQARMATETPPDPGHPRHQDSGIAPSMKCGSSSAMSSNPSKAAG